MVHCFKPRLPDAVGSEAVDGTSANQLVCLFIVFYIRVTWDARDVLCIFSLIYLLVKAVARSTVVVIRFDATGVIAVVTDDRCSALEPISIDLYILTVSFRPFFPTKEVVDGIYPPESFRFSIAFFI